MALADEIEDIRMPEDLPEEVWDTAAQGVPLRDAYLRYWYAETVRRQAAGKCSSAAPLKVPDRCAICPDDPRPEEAAFARSFQTAME